MARSFGASGSDATLFLTGSGFTALNDLAQGNFTYGVVGRRTSDNNNLYLGGKNPGSSTSAGWEFLTGFNVGGANPGHLRLLVWTNGTRYDVSAGTADTSNTTILNQHEMMVATWAQSTGAVKMYRGPIESPIKEVTAYTNNTTGTGTASTTDAPGVLKAWNIPRGSQALPFNGDGSWVFVYNRVLNQNELQVVQEGILTYRAGCEVTSSVIQTRGVNIMKSISGYVLLNYQDASGNFFEYSGNAITASNSGTAFSIGAESSNWVSPLQFEDDLEYSIPEQTIYRYTTEFAKFTVSSSATQFTAWYRTTLDPATYPSQSVLAYSINNALPVKLASAVLNTTGSTTPAFNSASIAGLTGSNKAISFINGARSHPSGSPEPHQGTYLTLAQFNAPATIIAPPARTNRMVAIGDSIQEGFLADIPQQYAGLQTLRQNLPAWLDSVQMWGAGGNALYDYFVDAATTTGSINRIVSSSMPRTVVIALMANDQGRAYWSTATAKPAVLGGINLLLKNFSGSIYLIPATPTNNETNSNSFGETYPTWRAMLATLPVSSSDSSRVFYVDTMSPPWVNTGSQMADSVHPNTSGHQSIATKEATLFANDPLGPRPGGLTGAFTIGTITLTALTPVQVSGNTGSFALGSTATEASASRVQTGVPISSSIGSSSPSGTANLSLTGTTGSFALGTITTLAAATISSTGLLLSSSLGSPIVTPGDQSASINVSGSGLTSTIGLSPISAPSWLFRRSITIDHTKIPSTLYNFPIVVAGVFPWMRTVANGGRITNDLGYDVGFFSDSILSSSLIHERGLYTGSTGQIAYYILIPTASSTVDTVIQIAYANPAVTTDLTMSSSVWDNNFVGVYHLGPQTLAWDNDSTALHNNLIALSATASLSVLDGSVVFDGTSSVLYRNATSVDRTPMTLEVMFKPQNEIPSDQVLVSVASTDTNAPGYELMLSSSQSVRGTLGYQDYTPDTGHGTVLTGSWNYASVAYSGSNERSVTLNNLIVNGPSVVHPAAFPQHNMSIGARYIGEGFKKQFDGEISEVRISNIDRTSAWRIATYNSLVNATSFAALGPEIGLLAITPFAFGSVATSAIGTSTVNVPTVVVAVAGVTGSKAIGQVSVAAISANATVTTTGVSGLFGLGFITLVAESLIVPDAPVFPVLSYRKGRKRIVTIRPLP
jgi:hypothetical protein